MMLFEQTWPNFMSTKLKWPTRTTSSSESVQPCKTGPYVSRPEKKRRADILDGMESGNHAGDPETVTYPLTSRSIARENQEDDR